MNNFQIKTSNQLLQMILIHKDKKRKVFLKIKASNKALVMVSQEIHGKEMLQVMISRKKMKWQRSFINK